MTLYYIYVSYYLCTLYSFFVLNKNINIVNSNIPLIMLVTASLPIFPTRKAYPSYYKPSG